MPRFSYYATEDITVVGRSNPPANPLNSGGNANGLDGTTLTIAEDAQFQAIDVTDTTDSNFDDDVDSQQFLTDPTSFGFEAGTSVAVDNEWTLILQAGDTVYTAYGVAVGPNENIVGLTFVGGDPAPGTELTVIDTLEGAGKREQPDVAYTELSADVSGVICFTPGALIRTPQGERLIESLQPGDQILTRDNGAQTLRWIGTSTLSTQQLAAAPHLKPVLVKAGALGPGLPARDMHLSPNHRLLIQGWRAEMMFGSAEVLVRAQAMRNDTSIMTDHQAQGVAYIHLLFDQHEVITSNGIASESFQPAADVTDGLATQTRAELLSLFPGLRTGDLGELAKPARATLTDLEAQALLMR